MPYVDFIGAAAAVLTTAAYLPQAIKVIRTRHTQSLSLCMYVAMTTGVALWLVYGFLIESWPILIGNAITLALALVILILKIRHG